MRDDAAAQHHAIDVIHRGRGLEELERLLHFEQHVLGDGAQHRLASSNVAPSTGCPSSAARPLRTAAEFLLHRFGVGVAANRDVAGEDRLVALETLMLIALAPALSRTTILSGSRP
jgi:hypothetical protein